MNYVYLLRFDWRLGQLITMVSRFIPPHSFIIISSPPPLLNRWLRLGSRTATNIFPSKFPPLPVDSCPYIGCGAWTMVFGGEKLDNFHEIFLFIPVKILNFFCKHSTFLDSHYNFYFQTLENYIKFIKTLTSTQKNLPSRIMELFMNDAYYLGRWLRTLSGCRTTCILFTNQLKLQ